MATLDDSPVGSPLSDLSSDAFEAEEAETIMPPAKRQKRGDSSLRATPALDDAGFISSDTDGDVPNSPTNTRPEDDDIHEQVTVCAWIGCNAGDLGDMDRLVEHIHNDHILNRQGQKVYKCEWTGCARPETRHSSAYALKSHMRSHTRDKPFFCALPECDRAFTRSDALAKHMRTVHETEALRPSDPIPKSMQPFMKSRLQPSIKSDQPQNLTPHILNGVANGSNDLPGWTSSYPAELEFTAEEEARGPVELHRLLRRQVHWAEEEGELLKRQCEQMEELRKKEWLDKEVLLDQVIGSEKSWEKRRDEVIKMQRERELAEREQERQRKSESTRKKQAVMQPQRMQQQPIIQMTIQQNVRRQEGQLQNMHQQEMQQQRMQYPDEVERHSGDENPYSTQRIFQL